MKKLARAAILIMTILSVCAFAACTGEKAYVFTDSVHLGSSLKAVVCCDKGTYEVFSKNAIKILDETDSEFNSQNPESFVYRFNKAKCGESVELSAVAKEAWTAAKAVYDLTEGAYDPTVKNYVDAWGFAQDANIVPDRPAPEPELLEALKEVSGTDKVEFTEKEGKAYLTKTACGVEYGGKTYGVKLDFGGLAKGFAVKKITDLCNELGITRGYVSYGSSSIYLLKNTKDADWDLKLTHPREDGTYYAVKASDIAASTSGDYERYYISGGKRFCHIIDGESGAPISNGVCSVTVIGCDPLIGDCLSTALCVRGEERIIEFANSDYAKANEIKVVAVFEKEDGLRVFSTADGEILSGKAYER